MLDGCGDQLLVGPQGFPRNLHTHTFDLEHIAHPEMPEGGRAHTASMRTRS